ncbi:MAG: glycosyltransferase family 4 protein [Verrucomicrobiota bacterium]|nr:glycosyltransferase family 4 protein [Verrucomicrobiota bacterium]
MKRLLNIIQCTNLGGMEKASLSLMQGLQEQQVMPSLISLHPLGQLASQITAAGIHARGIHYRGPFGVRSIPDYRRIMKAELKDIDWLLMTGHNLAGMLALASVKHHCPAVLALHFHHKGVKPLFMWKAIYLLANRTFRWITFPSHFIRDEACAIAPWISRKARVIRCPVAERPMRTATDKAAARKRMELADGVPVIGAAGWLIPRKRFDIVIQCLQRLRKNHTDIQLLIAGDGPEREGLQSLAEQCGVAKHIRWLGWIPCMDDFYQSLDVTLFTSDWDAMGMIALESMAVGVPVVASVKQGGLGEIITNEQHGYLYNNHSIDALAGALHELIDNPALCESVGRGGYERVRALHNTGRISGEYIQLFETATHE